MKQILQSLRTGVVEVADVPSPGPRAGQVLIHTTASLISAGTERMLLEFGQASWVDKARQQPDKVRAVLDKVRTDGVLPTIESVRNKLDQPLALGYCHVGVVAAVGAGVTHVVPGDRVASNGAHAEVVSVPANLCVAVPPGVPNERAAFTVLSAIALQGIRLAEPTLGETVAVIGLGLVGLLTVQLLRAQGCRVIGIDFAPDRLALARRYGAETVDLSAGADPVQAALAFSRERGVDAALITAATKSSEPIQQAAAMCRQRGRIVLVGTADPHLSRDAFFKKELTFQVSASYGPGRYDPTYEDKGIDYPFGFVRWTAQRNFEAVLDMMADGRLTTDELISHRFPIGGAEAAYALIGSSEPSLGVLLEYPRSDRTDRTVTLPSGGGPATENPGVTVLGAGNYATAMLLPAFKEAGARFETVVSANGVSSRHAGAKFGFRSASTDSSAAIADPKADVVVIATRHDSHARLVLEALAAGRAVFVEKPLCLTLPELTAIVDLYEQRVAQGKSPRLMVGFNRRFAPHVVRIKEALATTAGPKAFVYTVNAGPIPQSHWTQDRTVGGGRIVGEACHFIDLLRHLADHPIVERHAAALGTSTRDSASINLTFADGSIGTVHYLATGSKQFPKERLEVFVGGRVLQLDNFRRLRGFGWPGLPTMSLWRQDKGHRATAARFLRAVSQGLAMPIPFEEIVEVSRVAIELAST